MLHGRTFIIVSGIRADWLSTFVHRETSKLTTGWHTLSMRGGYVLTYIDLDLLLDAVFVLFCFI